MITKLTLIFAKDLLFIRREKDYFCLEKKFFLSPIHITPRWKFVPIVEAWEKLTLLEFKWFKAFCWLPL